MTDTIFALSSGHPPAAIAIVRISGPAAAAAGRVLAGSLPAPRHGALRTLRDAHGLVLDQALVLFFPGPNSATGEDLVELHCHGGRAVVAAVLGYLGRQPGLRTALPGEFTRRSLENGRVDIAQVEGLADLLEAESEEARVAAMAAVEGAVGSRLRDWSERLLALRAECEVAIDYAEEDDAVATSVSEVALSHRIAELRQDMADVLRRPPVERLRDGMVVVLAGPPNAGKSSLFNALVQREASIVTPIAGTTRDVIEAVVQHEGRAYRLVDTAGLVDATNDPVERIGVGRAREIVANAEIVLWLGSPEEAPARALQILAKADLKPVGDADAAGIATSIHDGGSIDRLWREIEGAAPRLGSSDQVHLHERQRRIVAEIIGELEQAKAATDPILIADHLRRTTVRIGSLIGFDPSEAMLSQLFSRFCLGK